MDDDGVGTSQTSVNDLKPKRIKQARKLLRKHATRIPRGKRMMITVQDMTRPSFFSRSHASVTGYRRKIKDLLTNNSELAKSLEDAHQEITRLERDLAVVQRQLNFRSAVQSKLITVSSNLNNVASLISDTVAAILEAKQFLAFSENNFSMDTIFSADSSGKLDDVLPSSHKSPAAMDIGGPTIQRTIWPQSHRRVLDMSTIAEVSVMADDIRNALSTYSEQDIDATLPLSLPSSCQNTPDAAVMFNPKNFSIEIDSATQNLTPENKEEPEPSDVTPKSPILSSQKYLPSLIPKPLIHSSSFLKPPVVERLASQKPSVMDTAFVAESPPLQIDKPCDNSSKMNVSNVTAKRGSTKNKGFKAKTFIDSEGNNKTHGDINSRPEPEARTSKSNYKPVNEVNSKKSKKDEKEAKKDSNSQKNFTPALKVNNNENKLSDASSRVVEHPINRKTFVVSTQPCIESNTDCDAPVIRDKKLSINQKSECQFRRETFLVSNDKTSKAAQFDAPTDQVMTSMSKFPEEKKKSTLSKECSSLTHEIESNANKTTYYSNTSDDSNTRRCQVALLTIRKKSGIFENGVSLRNTKLDSVPSAAGEPEPEPHVAGEKEKKLSPNATILNSVDMELTEVIRCQAVGGLPPVFYSSEDDDHLVAPVAELSDKLLPTNVVETNADLLQEPEMIAEVNLVGAGSSKRKEVPLIIAEPSETANPDYDSSSKYVQSPLVEKRARRIVKRDYKEFLESDTEENDVPVKAEIKAKSEKNLSKGKNKIHPQAKGKKNLLRESMPAENFIEQSHSSQEAAAAVFRIQKRKSNVYDVFDDSLQDMSPYKSKHQETEKGNDNNKSNSMKKNSVERNKSEPQLTDGPCESNAPKSSRNREKLKNNLFVMDRNDDDDLDPAAETESDPKLEKKGKKKSSVKNSKIEKKESKGKKSKMKVSATPKRKANSKSLKSKQVKQNADEKENEKVHLNDSADVQFDTPKNTLLKTPLTNQISSPKNPLKHRNIENDAKARNKKAKASGNTDNDGNVGLVNLDPVVSLENFLSPVQNDLGSDYLLSSFELKQGNVLKINSPSNLVPPVEMVLVENSMNLPSNTNTPRCSKNSNISRKISSFSTAEKSYGSNTSDLGSGRSRRKQLVSYREPSLHQKLRRP